MKTKGVVVLISVVLCLSSGLKSSGQEPSAASGYTLHSVAPHLAYSEILVYLQDGSSFSGFLAAVEPDALIVRKDGQDIIVPRQALRKILLKTDPNLNRNMLYGMAAGIYVGNILLLHDTYEPFAFAEKIEDEDIWWGLLFESMFAAGGIGLGYLATLLETGEKSFEFGTSEQAKAATWDKFRVFTAGVPQPAKIHFSIHGGSVFGDFSSSYDDFFGQAGYQSYAGASRFNLMRRVQLTYSPIPPLEFGLAYLSASEPSSSYYFYSDDGVTSVHSSFSSNYSQTGLYLVGALRPFNNPIASGNIGLAIGAARAQFEFTGYLDISEYMLDPVTQAFWTYATTKSAELTYKNTKTFFSGFVFAEVSFRLYQNLHLGISADYMLKRTEEIPPFVDFGIPAREVRLGNASIGFTMGWHF